MKINPWIHYRFESQIEDGTLYIFNSETRQITKSNEVAYDILKLIDSGADYDKIVATISEIWDLENQSIVDQFLENIQEQGFITGYEVRVG